ncbi:phosphatidylinositol phosphatase PTPRQ [Ixodes scapularis]|uniref:phosphatidylinositol phosphatase PTPRQ n=1 Tax=Ixodes scapularis TaxID=6945 RepID=UPI001A9FFA2F|nr:phosphatidylinositol phosphatase PTPRQ [Ixodes scapularis]
MQDYTLLKTRPSITDVRETSAIVSWDTTQDVDSYAANYWIQYRKLKQSWDKVVVVAVPKAPKYSRTLTGLRIGGAYEVRVLVIDSDGKFQETGSLTTKFRTVCGRPTSPPNSVKIDNSSADSVLITWENPPRESWFCWSANVTLEVNGTTESLNLTEPGVNATDRFVVPTRPFTELTVRLRLDTPDGTSSQWTSLWTVRSAEDAPSEVRQLQMTRSFARQASFTWLAPATPNGRIRDYGVVYRPLRPVIPCRVIEQAETKLIVPMSSQRVNLEKLRPYTVYIISVHAVTVKPGPEFSTNFTTEQDVPEGTPTALNYSKKTVDKYEIFWGPVPCELANGVVRHYYLELDSADPWESRLVNHTTGDMRLVFWNLLPYTRYRAEVFAENDAGRSQVAAELNFTTSPAAPPPPSNLTADQLSRTNLSLSWRPPYPPQGVLERYQIKFRTNALRSNSTLLNVDQYQCSSENSDLERHCFTVSNLLPVTIYRFSVRAFNRGTTHGPYSDELEIETGETVPDAPGSVRCVRREENSLKIQWDEPHRTNGILKHYRVNVSLTHSFSSSVNASTRPRAVVLEDLTTREYNLSDLYPGTTYRVCVQASTSAGFGDAVCDLFSTRAADPVVPMEPRVNGIVNSTINITLNSVDFVKGPITAYYVFVVRGSQDVKGPVVPVNFSDAQEMQLGYYTAAKFSHKEVRELSDFVLGAGNVVGGFENPPLNDATPYRIGLLVASNFSGEVRYGYRLSEPVVVGETDETSEIGIVLAAVLALLVLLALMSAALTCFCIRRRSGPDSQRKKSAQDPLSRLSKRDDSCLSDMRMTLSMDTGDFLNMTKIPKEGLPSKPAPATELQEYVTNGQAQDMDKYANFEIA